MLGQPPFYNQTTKNLISAFGTLFNDVMITRLVNGRSQTIKIPLVYQSADKAYNRATEDPGLNYNMAIVKPRMSFLMTDIEFDPERKVQPQHYSIVANSNNTTAKLQYQPVPYNLSFNLDIEISTIEDGLQIIEQILPVFNPEYMIKTKDFPSLNITRDTPVILNSVSFQDNTPDSDYTESRNLEWNLQFTLKALYYGPVQTVNTIKNVSLFLLDGLTLDAPLLTTISSNVNPQTANKTDTHTVTTITTHPEDANYPIGAGTSNGISINTATSSYNIAPPYVVASTSMFNSPMDVYVWHGTSFTKIYGDNINNYHATSITDDGQLITGFVTKSSITYMFIIKNNVYSEYPNYKAGGISSNNGIIPCTNMLTNQAAYYNTNTNQFVELKDLSGNYIFNWSDAYYISDDGTIITGSGINSTREGFYWTAASGLVSLGTVTASKVFISCDNSTIVGTNSSGVFYMPVGGSKTYLPTLANTNAEGISFDGKTILLSQAITRKTFLWNYYTGYTEITIPGGGSGISLASDGLTILGYTGQGNFDNGLFLYDIVNGFRYITDLNQPQLLNSNDFNIA